MDFNALKAIIDQQRSGNLFVLLGTDFSSDAIMLLTQRFCPDSKLTLDRAEMTENQETESIEIKGYLKEKLLGQENLRATATFTIVDGEAQMRVAFTGFPTNWKFGDYIKVVKGTIIDEFHYLNPTFILDSQVPDKLDENFQTQFDFPADKPAEGLELRQGLSFEAEIVRADIPKNLQWILSDSNEPYLKISGPMMIKFDNLLFHWKSTPVNFELAGKTVPLVLNLIMVSPDHINSETGWVASRTFATLSSEFSFQEPEEPPIHLPINAVITSSKFESLSIIGSADPETHLDISTLAGILGNNSISDTIPKEFPVLDMVLFEEFGFEIDLVDKSLSRVNLTVGFDYQWSLFENWLTIEDISILFLAYQPFSNPHLTVIVMATLELGSVDLDLRMVANTLDFQANLREGDKINLTQMLDSMIGLPNGMPEVVGTKFYIEGNIKQKEFLFSTTLESDWTLDIGEQQIAFKKLALELEYQGKTSTMERSVGGRIYGELAIAGATLYMSASRSSSTKSWTFTGGTMGDSTISLTGCVREIGKLFGLSLPGSTPEVNLKNLNLVFDTGSKSYTFIGTIDGKGKIPLVGKELDLETRINLNSAIDSKTGKRELTGYIEAFLQVGDNIWTLRYDMDTNISKVSASWRAIGGESLSIDDLLDALGIGDSIDIPDDLDPSLVEIALEYDHKNSFATLSGRTKEHGDAFMTVGRQDGKWGFVFGINITPTDGKVSKLPAVGQYLKAADFMELKQAGIIISTSQIKGYKIPALPLMMDTQADAGSALGNRPAQPVAASTPLQLDRGFTTVVVVDLDGQGAQGKAMAKVLPSAQFPFQLTYSGSAVSFYTGLSGTFSLPSADKPQFSVSNLGLKITRTITQEMTFSMMGGFDFTIFKQKLNVMLSLNMELDGMSAAVNVEAGPDGLPGPPGLKGFHLIQAGILMGVTYEPPAVEMVLQGKFKIGQLQNNADQFGIGMKMVQTPAWPTPVPVLSYLSFYIEEAGFDQLVTLITDKPADGATGALSNVKGYDLSFYYCEDQTILPDGSIALPGIGFSGQINFFGFGAYGEFYMMVDKGIRGHAEIAPINIHNVLKVNGGGKGLKRTFQKEGKGWKLIKNNEKPDPGVQTITKTIVKPGGAVVEFNALKSPFLYMNWKISLFDLVNMEVEAEITTKGIKFHLLYAISNALKFQIDCNLADWKSLTAAASLSIHVNMKIPGFKVNGVDIGDIKLNAGVDIALDLRLSAKEFHLGLEGKFEFQGSHFKVHVSLDAAPSDLKSIPKWIKDEILDTAEELFSDLFDSAEKYAKMVGDGIVDAGDKALEGMSKAYNVTADEFASLGKEMGHTTEEVGHYMKDGLGYTEEAVSGALQRAGYETKEVWNFMQKHFNLFQHVDVPHFDRKSEHFHGDVSKRYHADKRQHFDMKIAGKKVHADVGKTLGVDKKVSLTPHVDVKHTDLKPSYEKQHIDVKGVSVPKGKYGGQTMFNERVNVGVGTKIKISKWKKHLDLGHLDERLKVTVPKVPTSHVDVGHVDVKSKLP